MFTKFFYLLRERGIKVSPDEWMMLLEGMEKGLHQSSLIGFYDLCRAVLIKSEADFDRFDQVFLEFFQGVIEAGPLPELPEEFLKWLETPAEELAEIDKNFDQLLNESMEELVKLFQERIEEQKEEHNGGNYWIGTQGTSRFGNSGWHPGGIRVGGKSMHRTAAMVAGERKFRDFRKDNTLDIRQFQMAFRLLKQMSTQMDSSEKELDLDATIDTTCDHAGMLHVKYRNPRKNAVKILLLMDSGGSMDYHSKLCSMLFQAATQSNHFKELHTFYFHNCIYEELYRDPTLRFDSKVSTEWVLQNYGADYRVIIVGDAQMNEMELLGQRYDWYRGTKKDSGADWLQKFLNQYPRMIWLNPEPLPERMNYWTRTHLLIAEMFPMFHLSVDGLEQGMRKLMVRR